MSEPDMLEQEKNGLMECLFSEHDIEHVNIKFFRGHRDDLITAEEICEQARSAIMQKRMGATIGSKEAPKNTHPSVDVAEFISKL
jgi:hypothetical protein